MTVNKKILASLSRYSKRFEFRARLTKTGILSNLLIMLIAVFYLLNASGGHPWGDDFSMYILHADNILSGRPYGETNYIYNPDAPYIGPKEYPPVFPMMIVPILAIFGIKLKMLKLVGILCFIGFLFTINHRKLLSNLSFSLFLLYMFSLGTHPLFFSLSDFILTDLPFLFFCTVGLDLAQTFVRNSKKLNLMGCILAGLVIYLAYGTRSIGIILLPVLIVYDLFTNRRFSPSTLVILGFALVFIIAQSLLIPGTGNYFEQFPRTPVEAFLIIVQSVSYYIEQLGTFYALDNKVFQDMLFAFIAGLAIIGYILRVKKELTIFEVFFIFYPIPLLIWPSYQGLRFLVPVLPLYLIYAFEGLQFLATTLVKSQAIKGICLALLVIGVFIYYSNVYYKLLPKPAISDITSPDTEELFNFVRSQTKPDDIIAFYKPRALALFTDRKSLVVAVSSPAKEVFVRMKELGVDYFIVRLHYADEVQPDWINLVEKNPSNFELTFENNMFRAYRVIN